MNIQKTSTKTWIDADGQKVPVAYVSKFDRKKERTIGTLIKKANRLNAQLAEFKNVAFDAIDDVYNQMLADADIDPDQRKGNFTAYNFDKSVKVVVDVNARVEFDENINLAQAKIAEYLEKKLVSADADLAKLVNAAFTTTRGRLDQKRIFQLFKLQINDPVWRAAMDLIKKSISTNSSARYLSFYLRNKSGKYELVNLNFSNA